MDKYELEFDESYDQEFEIDISDFVTEIYPDLVDLEVTPTLEEQLFTHEEVYGYDKVKVNPIPEGYIIPELQSKEVTPNEEIQIVKPDNDYDGLGQVTVNPIPDGYLVPSGTLDITENGNKDVTTYESVNVDVQPELQSKSIEITANGEQNITADENYYGLSNVKISVNAIEHLEEELETYNNELTEQEGTINDILSAIETRAIAGKLPEKGWYISGRDDDGNVSEISVTGYTNDLPKMNDLISNIFSKCTKIKIADTVTNLPADCFQNNKYLTEIELNSEVDSAYSGWNGYGPGSTYTFGNCIALKKIDGRKLKNLLPSMFENCSSIEELEIKESIVDIPPRCFYNCSSLAWTKLPDNIKLLANKLDYYSPNGGVFYNCSNLALTEINDDVVVGNNNGATKEMFYGCTNLALTKLPALWTFIGQYMFYNCTNLKISDLTQVTAIKQYAFSKCSSLDEIILGDSLSTLEQYAFSYCSGLKKLTIRGTFTTLPYNCFEYCTSLEELNISTSGNSLALQQYCFQFCRSLKKLNSSIITMATAYSIFKNTGLISLCLPNIIQIGTSYSAASYDLFGTTTPLKAVWLGSTVTTINRYTFRGCASLLKIYIDKPRATVQAMSNYNYAFMNDASKQSLIICNDDEGFITKEEFDAIDWEAYTEEV